VRLENKSLKTKLKREEDARKHWQENCHKKDEEIIAIRKVQDELNKQLEVEKQSQKQVQYKLQSKIQRLKVVEEKSKKQSEEQ
jgi:hypothetical protein